MQTFPKSIQGAAKRSFHSEWYKAYTWLEYSQSKDAAYCFACRLFSLPNAASSVFTSVNGYSNWKKATFKDSGFSLHAKSDINAMTAWLENKRMGENNSSLFALMDHDHKKKVTENQNFVKTLAEILLLTATRNIAQRAHNESAASSNRGNFLEILHLISKHDANVNKQLTQSAKYTSNTIQNEILECLARMVRDEIIEEVKKSEQFAVIADETKDLKKKNRLPLC